MIIPTIAKIEVYFKKEEWSGQTNVYIMGIDTNGTRVLAKPMELDFSEYDDFKISKPSLSFDQFRGGSQFLQALLDGLVEAGFVPEKGPESELKATRFHLEDMRKITFKTLGVSL